ncbi:MAG: STAS domain-containing protein [Kouleothrix sp.]
MLAISQLFAAARRRIINTQNARLRELYTPIIPLYNGILASPLVGAIDAYRAGQVMESLLTGISQQQADVVIISITGVPMVDTDVANYLLMATRAARLLGANIILVGISAAKLPKRLCNWARICQASRPAQDCKQASNMRWRCSGWKSRPVKRDWAWKRSLERRRNVRGAGRTQIGAGLLWKRDLAKYCP